MEKIGNRIMRPKPHSATKLRLPSNWKEGLGMPDDAMKGALSAGENGTG